MLCLGTDCLIISDMTKGYGLGYLDYVSFSSAKLMRSKFPCFVLRASEPSVHFWSLAESPAVCVTNDWWETGRGCGARERGTWAGGRPPWIKLRRGDVSHRAAVALMTDASALEMHHCSGSVRFLQSKVNLTRLHPSSPPTPTPTWIPACVLPADGALLFYMHITVTFRDRCAHKNPLPPPRACKCACGGEDQHSYSHQACAVLVAVESAFCGTR